MAGFSPNTLVMHDYGGTPANGHGMFNPYHALVFPDGSIKYRNPENPYGQAAPHAYKLNPQSIGLSYAGKVGSQPTPEAMATLRKEAQSIGEMFPGIQPMSHGEAFAATKGTPLQASRDGRGLDEASWRSNLVYGPPAPGQATATAGASVPVSDRSITSFAGMTPKAQPAQRMALGGPMPAPQQENPFLDTLVARMQSPLFQGGMGMLVAANQGHDAASAMAQGMQTGMASQRNQFDMAERSRKLREEQALKDFWNNYDFSKSGLPSNLAGMMPGFSPDQRAQLAMQSATGQLPTAEDMAVKRATAQANLEQTQRENGLFDQKRQLLEAQTGQARMRENPGQKIEEEVQARRAVAKSLGIDEATPLGKQWIASGRFAREDQQELSATEKRMIDKADEQLTEVDATMEALQEASGLLDSTYEGGGARERAWMKNRINMGDDASNNTERYVQIMDSEAIKDMSRTLKGSTTNFELREFQKIISDPSRPIAVRRKALDALMRNVSRHREMLVRKSQGVRSGEYFKPQTSGSAPTHVFDPTTGQLKPVGGQ